MNKSSMEEAMKIIDLQHEVIEAQTETIRLLKEQLNILSDLFPEVKEALRKAEIFAEENINANPSDI